MFSRRFSPVPRNKLTQLLERERSRGIEILDLTVSNPTRVGLEYPGEAILKAIASPGSLKYEPMPTGLESAREAVADYYRSREATVSPGDIVLTASTSEAYSYLFKLLTNPGDEVLIPAPSYPLFEFLAAAESLRCVSYPLVYEDGWAIDMERLRQLATPSVRALLIVHPNNPTGSLIKPREWAQVQHICQVLQIPVVCDEVFVDYRLSGDPLADFLIETDIPVYLLNGLSKISALPQMKLGWIVLRGPSLLKQAAKERLETISDTYLSVGTPVQLAVPELLRIRTGLQEQIGSRVRKNLEALSEILACSAASPLEVEGGWYAVIRVPSVLSEEDWSLKLLEKCRTLVHPGYFYDFPGGTFVIASLLTEPSVFSRGLARFRDLVLRTCAP